MRLGRLDRLTEDIVAGSIIRRELALKMRLGADFGFKPRPQGAPDFLHPILGCVRIYIRTCSVFLKMTCPVDSSSCIPPFGGLTLPSEVNIGSGRQGATVFLIQYF